MHGITVYIYLYRFWGLVWGKSSPIEYLYSLLPEWYKISIAFFFWILLYIVLVCVWSHIINIRYANPYLLVLPFSSRVQRFSRFFFFRNGIYCDAYIMFIMQCVCIWICIHCLCHIYSTPCDDCVVAAIIHIGLGGGYVCILLVDVLHYDSQ